MIAGLRGVESSQEYGRLCIEKRAIEKSNGLKGETKRRRSEEDRGEFLEF